MSLQVPGLRERKKAETRAAIQHHAFTLFGRQGYGATTTTHIAAAAGISPATFFRYFPTKEDVVLFDALDLTMHENGEPPAHLTPIGAVRWILITALASLTPQQLAHQRDRYALIQTVPELRARMADEIIRNTSLLAAVIARRTHKDQTDPEVQVIASAIIGVTLTTLLNASTKPRLDYIELLRMNLTELESRMKQ